MEFSIVIPSRDRPKQLQRCLTACAALETPKDQYEVIVVDDGSREPYAELLSRFDGRMQLRPLRRDGSGPGMARNSGASAARGRYIALTDDDCAPAPDWLEQFRPVARRDALIGGRTINAVADSLCSEASQQLISYLYDYYNADPLRARFFASCNMAMPTDTFNGLGGFDAAFQLAGGEDRDFCDRWLASGRVMIYAPGAVVHHHHELSLHKFLRQHFNYGRGAWRFHQARSVRRAGPVKIEPVRFYSELLAYPFRQPEIRQRLLVSALMGASQAANAAGFFYERIALP